MTWDPHHRLCACDLVEYVALPFVREHPEGRILLAAVRTARRRVFHLATSTQLVKLERALERLPSEYPEIVAARELLSPYGLADALSLVAVACQLAYEERAGANRNQIQEIEKRRSRFFSDPPAALGDACYASQARGLLPLEGPPEHARVATFYREEHLLDLDRAEDDRAHRWFLLGSTDIEAVYSERARAQEKTQAAAWTSLAWSRQGFYFHPRFTAHLRG